MSRYRVTEAALLLSLEGGRYGFGLALGVHSLFGFSLTL